MAKVITVIGKPGSGKSTSLRNLNPAETLIIKPNNKPLPFAGAATKYKNGQNVIQTKELKQLNKLLRDLVKNDQYNYIKTLVIEDFTHYMNAVTLSSAFRGSGDKFGRWADFGASVYNVVAGIAESSDREDLTIVLICHVEDKPDGSINIKTSGKLLDNEVEIASYVTYQFYAHKVMGKNGLQHVFMTNSDGRVECKSPMHYFLHRNVPNDLSKIIERINKLESLPDEELNTDEKVIALSRKLDEEQYPDFDFASVE
jgi:hypothetical protein